MANEENQSCEPSPCLTADLAESVSWWATPGSDGQAGVSLEGTIYNNGSENMNAIVHIRVFDGKTWRNFVENAGVVPAGGTVDFYWDQGLGQIDENAVVVEYVVSRGQGNEVPAAKSVPQEIPGDRKKKWSWEWHWQKGSG